MGMGCVFYLIGILLLGILWIVGVHLVICGGIVAGIIYSFYLLNNANLTNLGLKKIILNILLSLLVAIIPTALIIIVLWWALDYGPTVFYNYKGIEVIELHKRIYVTWHNYDITQLTIICTAAIYIIVTFDTFMVQAGDD